MGWVGERWVLWYFGLVESVGWVGFFVGGVVVVCAVCLSLSVEVFAKAALYYELLFD